MCKEVRCWSTMGVEGEAGGGRESAGPGHSHLAMGGSKVDLGGRVVQQNYDYMM